MSARSLLRSPSALGCALVCLTVAGSPVAGGQEPVRSRALALTFDDLPFVAAGEAYFPAATRTTAELLRVLRRHRAQAVGFVNEGQLDAGASAGALVSDVRTRYGLQCRPVCA